MAFANPSNGSPDTGLRRATPVNRFNGLQGLQGINGSGVSPQVMEGEEHVTSFWSRYESARLNDLVKNVLLEDVITRYENLVIKHNQYVKDHHRERELATNFVETEARYKGLLDHLQGLLNRDPFVLLLIDGDGLIFRSSYLRDGENGGRRAADALNRAVKRWTAENVVDCKTLDVKVVVRVFANIKGLATVCTNGGIISSPDVLEQFARGFTRGNNLFDFVDVGYGKDRADSKVSETFKLFLTDYHCRQIVLGCSHDNGYARLLEQFVNDPEANQRVTLLEGVPFEKELTVLPFRTVKFGDIFRDSKLVTTMPDLLTGTAAAYRPRVDSSGLSADSAVFTPRTGTPYSPAYSPGVQRNSHLRAASITSSLNSSEPDTPVTGAIGSWSNIAKASASKPFVDIKPRTASNSADMHMEILRNVKGQRIDPPLEYDKDEVQRLKKIKLCNQHYIGPNGCCHYNAGKEDKCPHRHDKKMTKHELHCLRIVARETPCKKKMDCDDPTCIYGHRCPFPTATEGGMRGSGYCLNGENCRFAREMHGTDTRAVKTVKIGAF
ncbi:zinc finger protein [Teratosphaeria destructans]|uniref:Zinc finger protein n=1 Tax=Teratosphaeria destructans TaxID=418781 RepID=A0A9W7W2J8_9PEZI|nr:zinc finger protein [Teratosphaeria destructans]